MRIHSADSLRGVESAPTSSATDATDCGGHAGARIAPGPPQCSLEAPDRRLPSLEEALVDTYIPSMAPTEVPLSGHALPMLERARRVLVVGHVPPDADCVGAALGLSRTLRALGKEADALVDSMLPGKLRQIAAPGEMTTFEAAAERPYDLVVLVDVAARERIGRAQTLLDRAPAVLVVDHHMAHPSAASLGLAPKARFGKLVATTAESASFLVAVLAGHLDRRLGSPLRAEAWRGIAQATSLGAMTDTAAVVSAKSSEPEPFKAPGTALGALSLLKYMVHEKLGGDASHLEQLLHYQLPLDVSTAVDVAVPRTERKTLLGKAALFVAGREVVRDVLALGAKTGVNALDLRGHLQDRLDGAVNADPIAVLLFEEEGGVRLSLRSKDPTVAPEIAQALGGGGKHGSAGAFVAGDLASVRSQVEGAIDAWASRRLLALRAGH